MFKVGSKTWLSSFSFLLVYAGKTCFFVIFGAINYSHIKVFKTTYQTSSSLGEPTFINVAHFSLGFGEFRALHTQNKIKNGKNQLTIGFPK